MREIKPVLSVCSGFQEQRSSVKGFFLLLPDKIIHPATKQTKNFVTAWLANFVSFSI